MGRGDDGATHGRASQGSGDWRKWKGADAGETIGVQRGRSTRKVLREGGRKDEKGRANSGVAE